MDSKKVRLRQWIFDFKDFREVVDSTMGTFQGKSSLFLETFGRIHTYRYALSLILALSHSLDVFKIANCPCQKLDK